MWTESLVPSFIASGLFVFAMTAGAQDHASGTGTAACSASWRLAYRHDADGRMSAGSRQALVDAVRRGAPLRVAWGFAAGSDGQAVTVEHAAEPVFVTTMNGEQVFAQLPEHIGQSSHSDPSAARFDRPSVMWRGLLGTDGTFDAVYVDRATGAVVRRLPQCAGVAWFAELTPVGCDSQEPLELAVPGGVRRDGKSGP